MLRDLSVGKRREVRRTARIAMIAMFVALIAAGAFVKIPIGIVPVSLQYAAAVTCAMLLGPWDSLVAIAIYIAMGLIGIPVFVAGGGFAYVLQPTFGYLAGYLFALPIGGMIARGVKGDAQIKFARLVLGALTTMAIVHVFGVMYMYFILNFYVGSGIEMGKAWMTGSVVFLPTDCAFSILAAIVARRVAPIIDRAKIAGRGVKRYLTYEEYRREKRGEEE